MINQQNFEDKNNYQDVYLRCVIAGFLAFFKNRIKWTNYFESGPVEVNVPAHYPLGGDTRFVMDAFFDDIKGTRVDSNTDQIPRSTLELKSWAIKMDEFSNPNVWVNQTKELDDELIQTVAQVKSIPIKLTFNFDTIVSSEIDLFKLWQQLVTKLFIYRYFTFDYMRLPINAVFSFTLDVNNPMVRDTKFGDVNACKLPLTFDLHTFFPIFDVDNEYLANQKTQWILQIWQNNRDNGLNKIVDRPLQ